MLFTFIKSVHVLLETKCLKVKCMSVCILPIKSIMASTFITYVNYI